MIWKKRQYFIWLIPMLLFLVGLVVIPLVVTIIDSLYRVNLLDMNGRVFVGVQNYIKLFSDSNVIRSLVNTSFYVTVALIVETFLGILVAVALKEKFCLRGIIIAVLILPWALPPIVNGIMWKLIFDPTIGMINSILMKTGIITGPFIWLNNPEISKICIVIVHIWRMLPLISIIFLAKMQTIPTEILEAASLDGANKRGQFFTMILPNIKSVLLITLSQGCIGAFHLFDEPYSMTGMASDTRSILIQDYLIAFREYELGKGMALAMVISIGLLGAMLLLGIMIKRGVSDA